MALPAIGAGVSAGINLIGMIKGKIDQRNANRELAKLDRPVYSRPDEIVEMGNIAAMLALDPNMPGYGNALDNIKAGTANAVQAAKELGGAGDIMSIVAQENKAKNDLSVQNAAFNLQNKRNYLDVLQILGGYSDQEFDYNINLPYQEEKQRLKQKAAAGAETANSAINNLSSMGASLLGADLKGDIDGGDGAVDLSGLEELLKNLDFGGGTTTTSGSGDGMRGFGSHY